MPNRETSKGADSRKAKQYNKLVRDKIPEIIEADGQSCKIEVLSEDDYIKALDNKLDEELTEYQKDQNIEELADLVEVIYATVEARGWTLDELETARREKAEKRGAFRKRLLLKEIVQKEKEEKVKSVMKDFVESYIMMFVAGAIATLIVFIVIFGFGCIAVWLCGIFESIIPLAAYFLFLIVYTFKKQKR